VTQSFCSCNEGVCVYAFGVWAMSQHWFDDNIKKLRVQVGAAALDST
jgi:hypothetical protein